jgi:uncharacterized C2H2 Zn-finger protein
MQQGIDEATKLYDEAKAKPEGERKDGLRAAIKRLSTLMEPFDAYDEKQKEITKLKADPELKKLQATEKTLLNVIVKAADDRIKQAEALLQKAKASNPGERAELLKQATAILDKGAAGLRELKAKSIAAATSGAAAATAGAAAVVTGANTCPTCKKTLKTAQGLADHVKAAHPAAAAKPAMAANTCTVCGKTLKSAQGLADHTKAAHPVASNACPKCGKTLKSAQGVIDHMKAAHGG